MVARRRFIGVLCAAPVLLAACRSQPEVVADPAGSAVPDARSLLQDLESALDAAFGPLTWETGSEERTEEDDGACTFATELRRCQTYIGHERGTPQQIAEALSPVLRDHDWPALPKPEGGTGGWLSAESVKGSLTFRFRAKGLTEIGISGAIAATPCEAPSDS